MKWFLFLLATAALAQQPCFYPSCDQTSGTMQSLTPGVDAQYCGQCITISNGVVTVVTNPPPAINYVPAPSMILSNGVWFTGRDGHVYSLDVSNGVQIVTQIGSALTVASAEAKITSNQTVTTAIETEAKTNSFFATASAAVAGASQSTIINQFLAIQKPATALQTNVVRLQAIQFYRQARKDAGQ